jgi:DNA polymerase elongation subunit (family B)
MSIVKSTPKVPKVQYELVCEHKGVLYARLFDPVSRKSVMRKYVSDEYVPPIFIPSSDQSKTSEYTSFTTGEKLVKKTYPNIYDLGKAIKNFKDIHVDVYGNTNRSQHYISQNFPTPLNSTHDLRTWFLDIETRSMHGFAQPENPTEEISMIQIWDSFDKTFFILATKECDILPSSELGEVKYRCYQSEWHMMVAFLDLIKSKDPTVICGFNSNFFDIPYITNRLDRLKIPKNALSPIGIITSAETTTPEKITYTKFDWVGRYLLDYRELFIKYSYDKLAKYSLEYVATHVLGTGKVEHDEYHSLEDLYNKDFNKFVQYGITDVELLIQMDNKLKFISTAFMIAYTCGVNAYDVFGTLKQWSSFMYNEAMQQNKILPLQQQFTDHSAIYVGGWVKSTPGKHKWVVSFDFSSLYPSNTRFINIGVDTLVKENLSREEAIKFEISRLEYERNKKQ